MIPSQTEQSNGLHHEMSSPKQYSINVTQDKIDSLKQRLSLVALPGEIQEAAWDLGCPLEDVRRLVNKWKQWDWREAEKKLNELPHFHTEVELDGFGSLDIHFVHQRSEVQGAIPLLFVHGCEFS